MHEPAGHDPAGLSRPVTVSVDEIAPVWVLDDAAAADSAAVIAIAERLGVPHLRVPLVWNWRARLLSLLGGGSLLGMAAGQGVPWPLSAPRGPALVLSAGRRAQSVALWLRAKFGSRIVHFGQPPFGLHADRFDLLLVPRHDRIRLHANMLPVLGVPNRLSPLVLSQARLSWAARLAHMPRPLVALLAGGGSMGGAIRPSSAYALARAVAGLANAAGGSVVATTSQRTGAVGAEGLAAGLAASMHLIHRWNEPGDNPYLGFLGLADATVVTGDSALLISEACAAESPVFVASLGDTGRQQRLHACLYRAGQLRPLGESLAAWPRTPLDEAGRIATEIRARMALGPHAID